MVSEIVSLSSLDLANKLSKLYGIFAGSVILNILNQFKISR